MKKKVVGLLFVWSLLQANEVDRINSLIEEVKTLRINYDKCQEKLGSNNAVTLVEKNAA